MDLDGILSMDHSTNLENSKCVDHSHIGGTAPSYVVGSERSIIEPHFDIEYYIKTNPDVANSDVDPLTHYLFTGWHERRDPSSAFSTRFYLETYPDVEAMGVNPFWHYISSGKGEGRACLAEQLGCDGQRLDDDVLYAPIPQYFFLELTSQCNLKCPYCPTGRGDIPLASRGSITDANFEVIFQKISPYAEVVDLFNWGEPFMHKGILDFIERFSDLGIKTQISSNLSVRLFSEQELERIVESGLHSLLASIDGVTQGAYSAYRWNGSVKKALANLENIQKTKERLGSTTPYLTWAYYLNIHNQDEVEYAQRLANEIGVDIWFKKLSCPPEFQTTLIKDRPSVLNSPENAPILWQPRTNRGLGSFDLDKRLPSTCNVCRMPFEIMNINFNGDVFPCTTVSGEAFRVGNLLTDTIEDIWANKMKRNRRQLLCTWDKLEDSQCYHCKHFPKD
jgi:radical SAM protein with 4Fe4S-binding SPASM domain